VHSGHHHLQFVVHVIFSQTWHLSFYGRNICI
jgi:hypothetical protein